MKMYHGQYQRIESKAGGVGCTARQFIRAAHSKLSPIGRSRAQRSERHEWLRHGLEQLTESRALYRRVAVPEYVSVETIGGEMPVTLPHAIRVF